MRLQQGKNIMHYRNATNMDLYTLPAKSNPIMLFRSSGLRKTVLSLREKLNLLPLDVMKSSSSNVDCLILPLIVPRPVCRIEPTPASSKGSVIETPLRVPLNDGQTVFYL